MKKMCQRGCGHRHSCGICPPKAISATARFRGTEDHTRVGIGGEHKATGFITEWYESKRVHRPFRTKRRRFVDERGVAVAGVGGSKAKTHRAGRKAAKELQQKRVA